METLQISLHTASTTDEGYSFGEQPFDADTPSSATAWRDEARGLQEAVKIVTHWVSDEDFINALQHSLEIGSDLFHASSSAIDPMASQTAISNITSALDRLPMRDMLRVFFDLLSSSREAPTTVETEAQELFEPIAGTTASSPHIPEDFIGRIKMALEQGDYPSARHYANMGVQRYPDNPNLHKYATVLAPPKVVRRALPPTTSVRANRDWLKKNANDYRGRWVALQDGELKGVANSLNELIQQIGDTKGILLTKV